MVRGVQPHLSHCLNIDKEKTMSRDATEYLDEYCRETWGHTNWGYTSTYSKEELADESKIAEYELGGSVVIWKKADTEDLEETLEQLTNIIKKNISSVVETDKALYLLDEIAEEVFKQ